MTCIYFRQPRNRICIPIRVSECESVFCVHADSTICGQSSERQSRCQSGRPSESPSGSQSGSQSESVRRGPSQSSVLPASHSRHFLHARESGSSLPLPSVHHALCIAKNSAWLSRLACLSRSGVLETTAAPGQPDTVRVSRRTRVSGGVDGVGGVACLLDTEDATLVLREARHLLRVRVRVWASGPP